MGRELRTCNRARKCPLLIVVVLFTLLVIIYFFVISIVLVFSVSTTMVLLSLLFSPSLLIPRFFFMCIDHAHICVLQTKPPTPPSCSRTPVALISTLCGWGAGGTSEESRWSKDGGVGGLERRKSVRRCGKSSHAM
jgi:hypothetical protein